VKRSEVNLAICEAIEVFAGCDIHLPGFAYWRPADWIQRMDTASQLMLAGLGWDVVEWSPGPFADRGLLLFTLRNVVRKSTSGFVDGYAEKLMLIREGQRTPMHTHKSKMEDIINRGGGRLVIEFGVESGPGEALVILNGILQSIDSTARVIELDPGDSVTLMPGVYHSFYATGADVIAGEVSTYNDDAHDNLFIEPMERYPQLDEDEPPEYLIAADYLGMVHTDR